MSLSCICLKFQWSNAGKITLKSDYRFETLSFSMRDNLGRYIVRGRPFLEPKQLDSSSGNCAEQIGEGRERKLLPLPCTFRFVFIRKVIS